MKRYIEINADISFDKYNSGSWELNINILPKDVVTFFMEIQLLEFNHADCITIKSLTTIKSVNLIVSDLNNESSIDIVNDKFKVIFSHGDIGYISSFLLQYYRDSYAPVSHVHIDITNNGKIGTDGTLTISAIASAPPISGEEAKKILGI